ncbi:MAG: hypothetical protein GX443_08030 [Deltaproteobacteria bacterium]|nr:hypothetical protein [Deltaproteobacteria bacterium]
MKKILKSTLMGVSIVALAGTASAAQIDINLYGASAQHLFWNDAADDFLTSKGCTNVGRDQKDSKNGITRGTCGSDTVYIRYSSKASFDGVLAVKGDSSLAGSAEKCNEGDPGVPPGQAGYYRKMVDETSCTGWSGGQTCTALKCQRVTLGASDVAGESFVQVSAGQLFGPLGGGFVSRSFSSIDTTGLNHYNPLVVPFGFFVNKSVKKDGAELDNISRMQAVQIFSGQVFYWTDFGQNFSVTGNPQADVVACLRHAGSGTHATLDFAVVRGNGWGASLPIVESIGGPNVYFNDGSSDMMKCINGSGSWTGQGAIGYADADQSLSSYTNTKALKYNGEAPTRVNIRNGLYDFWSVQWLYENPSAPNYSTTHPWISTGVDAAPGWGLMEFASKAGNVPSTKALYWAAKDEMNFMKATDQNYPGYVGCTDCQTP